MNKTRLHLYLVALSFPLSGCLATGDPLGLNALNDSTAKFFGTYQAPLLAAFPQTSECGDRDERCRVLDLTEAQLYQAANEGRLKWIELVDLFYAERARQFPNTFDDSGVREWFSFQRMLAEQRDLRKITETQWVYYHEQKSAEMNSRAGQDAANRAMIRQQHAAPPLPRPRNCWTTRNGNSYYTTCD